MSALDGVAAVVTGASRGIGAAVAGALTDAGARVARLARGGFPADSGDRRGGGPAIQCDVTVEADVARAVSRIREELGDPRILVNNAGSFLLRPFEETTVDDLRTQLEANLVGTFRMVRAFLPAMVERGGHIVTIGSVVDYQGFPGNAAYAASKYGVRGLHDVLRAEYVGRGVRFTLISPGPTDTRLWDAVDPDARDDLPKRAAMLQPADVADAVLFAVTRPARAQVELMRLGPS